MNEMNILIDGMDWVIDNAWWMLVIFMISITVIIAVMK